MAELSARGLSNIGEDVVKSIMMAAFTNPFSEVNLEGIVLMGIAENTLMHSELVEYISSNFSINSKMLTYGDGPTGSLELRTALAAYINANFLPKEVVQRHHVMIMSGGSSVIDSLCFCIAGEGDGILIARPLYVGFVFDFGDRAKVKPVFVEMKRLEDVTTLEGVKRHEEALLASEARGVKIRGLMLCNPHNPLGRCYSPEVLVAYLALCSKYRIHLISDEVYARSVFPSSDIPTPLPFSSILSLDIQKYIDPSLVHVLYGMSKDFCCNGLRVGAFISQHNPQLHQTMAVCSQTAWASSMSDKTWALMLQDQTFLDTYFSDFTKKMTAAYEDCISILKADGIPYIPANCGPFIWIDLTSHLEESTIAAERILAWKMIKGGVWLATGEAFRSEVPGWFRITFAMADQELGLGMDRLRKVLQG